MGRICAAQFAAIIGLALACSLVDPMLALSLSLGGVVYGTANGYAAWRLFNAKGQVSEQGELANMYRAVFGKMLMFGALTAATFAGLKGVNVGAYVGGCIVAMIAGVIGAATYRESAS